jgi:glycosyltransferase involved in cell wall biosynthesis
MIRPAIRANPSDLKQQGVAMKPACFPAGPSVAVLIPCYNEEAAIAKVVADFTAALPGAGIYVYDNRSADRTAEVARRAGATVRSEPRRGKGNVIRRMFADIDADVYVLVDGDDTYEAGDAPAMIAQLISERLDMVVGTRLGAHQKGAFRSGHRIGNDILTGVVGYIFGRHFTDMLSGYRVFSRRFVKSFPALAAGFETETELTIHALGLRMPVAEKQTVYRSRSPASQSKLNTYRDGLRIMAAIILLFKEERPLLFFNLLFLILASVSLALAYPIVVTYLATGLVPRFPTAILSTGIMILAFLSLASGFILDTVTRGRREFKRLVYLSIPWQTQTGATQTPGAPNG